MPFSSARAALRAAAGAQGMLQGRRAPLAVPNKPAGQLLIHSTLIQLVRVPRNVKEPLSLGATGCPNYTVQAHIAGVFGGGTHGALPWYRRWRSSSAGFPCGVMQAGVSAPAGSVFHAHQ